MPLSKAVKHWLRGLLGSAIGNGSGGVIAGLTAMGIAPESFNFGSGIGHLFGLMGTCFAVNSVIGLMSFLKATPIPAEDEPDKQ